MKSGGGNGPVKPGNLFFKVPNPTVQPTDKVQFCPLIAGNFLWRKLSWQSIFLLLNP